MKCEKLFINDIISAEDLAYIKSLAPINNRNFKFTQNQNLLNNQYENFESAINEIRIFEKMEGLNNSLTLIAFVFLKSAMVVFRSCSSTWSCALTSRSPTWPRKACSSTGTCASRPTWLRSLPSSKATCRWPRREPTQHGRSPLNPFR